MIADTTTLCYCWSILREDGVRVGFTDHDNELSIDGEVFIPVDGVLTTQIKMSLNLDVDDLEVEGAISDDSLSEVDLETGVYDDATVVIMLVNWMDVSDKKVLVTGRLGSIVTSDYGFTTDFNSLANRLNKVQGRVFQRTCDAELGDATCGIDLTSPLYRTTAVVTEAGELSVVLDDLTAYERDWFVLGEFVSASGHKYGVRGQTDNRIELWEAPFPALTVGETITLTAGCKKSTISCKDKFNNIMNYQGFALFMPGQDALTDYPVRGEQNYDGGSLFS